MGNARWKGVPLKTVLDKAGVQQGAKQVVFGGLDGPVSDKTPDFAKALDVDHARDGEVMLAYSMNGQDLPVLNGFPLRLIVPGYYGTYWVKHLNEITVIDDTFDGFWMKTAYRIPDTPHANVKPGESGFATVPINRMTPRSFFTNLTNGATVKPGAPLSVNRGLRLAAIPVSRKSNCRTTEDRPGGRPHLALTRASTAFAEVERGGRGAAVRDVDAAGALHQRQWRSAGRLSPNWKPRRLHAQRDRERAARCRVTRKEGRAVHEPIIQRSRLSRRNRRQRGSFRHHARLAAGRRLGRCSRRAIDAGSIHGQRRRRNAAVGQRRHPEPGSQF